MILVMNKIKVDIDEILINDNNPFYLKIEKERKYNLIVQENVHCKLIIVGYSNYDMNINLKRNSQLIVNSLNINNNANVLVNLEEFSKVIYNHSVISQNNSVNKFTINHNNDNTESILNNNGINILDNKLYFSIDGVIPLGKKNIICNQNSKIINISNGDSKIIPNLIIDSDDIVANHSAYIGKIDDDIKMYFQTRGISNKGIESLIYKALLLNKMDLSIEKEEFNQIINEWW